MQSMYTIYICNLYRLYMQLYRPLGKPWPDYQILAAHVNHTILKQASAQIRA